MRENRDQSDHGGRMEDARGRSFQADHGRIGMNKSILIRVAPARGNTKKQFPGTSTGSSWQHSDWLR